MEEYLKKRDVDEKLALKITSDLLDGYRELHQKLIIHRDIKPENILVKGDLLKLADFGSARLIHTPQPYTEYISTR